MADEKKRLPLYCPVARAAGRYAPEYTDEELDKAKPCPAYALQRAPGIPPQLGTPGGVLVITHAPGYEEDMAGRPAAGAYVSELLAAARDAGVPATSLSFGNACRCRCPNDKVPAKVSGLCVSTWLLDAVQAAQPGALLVCGAEALKAVLGRAIGGVARVQGCLVEHVIPGLPPVVGAYSPGYVLRNPAAYHTALVDATRLASEVAVKGAAVVAGAAQEAAPEVRVVTVTCEADVPLAVELLNALAQLPEGSFVSFDVETNGLDPWMRARPPKLLTVSVSWSADAAVVIPVDHPEAPTLTPEAHAALFSALRAALTAPQTIKVGHNLKFDAKWLHVGLGWAPSAAAQIRGIPGMFDTMLAHALVDPDSAHGLDDLVRRYAYARFGAYWSGIHDAAKVEQKGDRKKHKTRKTHADQRAEKEARYDYSLVPLPMLVDYNAKDTAATWWLSQFLLPKLLATGSTFTTFRDITMPASETYLRTELAGMALDPNRVREFTVDYRCRLVEAQARLEALPSVQAVARKTATGVINWNSTQQKAALLFQDPDGFRATPQGFTETGAPSTDAENLTLLSRTAPTGSELQICVAAMREVAEASKVLGTYLCAVPRWVGSDGRIHTRFNLSGARTGRTSSSDPNLQNQPKSIRPIFRSRWGDKGAIMQSDYCLAEGAKVLLEAGFKPIEKVVAGVDRVLLEDGTPREVEAVIDRGVFPLVELRTECGYRLRATREHRIRVINAEGHYAWARIGDLTEGSHVVLQPGLPSRKRRASSRQIALAEFYGFLTGNGALTIRGATRWCVNALDEDTFLRLLVAAHLLSEKVSTHPIPIKGVRDAGIYSVALWHRLVERLGVNKVAPPPFLDRAPRGVVCAWLRGFFEADGSASGDHISASAKRESLLQGVQRLLLALGIPSRVSPFVSTVGGKRFLNYVLAVKRCGVDAFVREVGFIGRRKSGAARALAGASTEPARRVLKHGLPNQHFKVRMVCSRDRRLSPTLRRAIANISQRPDARVSPETARQMRVERPGWFAQLGWGRFLSCGQLHDRVASITDAGVAHCYDLSVPPETAYIAEGFVNHNSQLEARVAACFSMEEGLLSIFREGRDFHIMNAALMLGKNPGRAIKAGPDRDWGDVTPEDRDRGKSAVSFGLMYGRSFKALAKDLGIPEDDAKRMVESYFSHLPRFVEWVAEMHAWARANGYVDTATGRRRWLPDVNATEYGMVQEALRQAVNSPIQGTASDMTVSALVRYNAALIERGMRSVPVATVHDSIVVDCPLDEAHAAAMLLQAVMTDVSMYPWAVIPFDVEIDIAARWEEH